MQEPNNAGHSMSIHAIPSIVSYAFPKAFTTSNITAGFRATGIWPFDQNIFGPEKFLPASTTNRELQVDSNTVLNIATGSNYRNCKFNGISD